MQDANMSGLPIPRIASHLHEALGLILPVSVRANCGSGRFRFTLSLVHAVHAVRAAHTAHIH